MCEVSKRLYTVASPILYRSIAITADDDLPDRIDLKGIILAQQRANLLCYTKGIQVLSPFSRMLEGRCLHNNPDYNDFDNDEDDCSKWRRAGK